jgi:hypothetical protein
MSNATTVAPSGAAITPPPDLAQDIAQATGAGFADVMDAFLEDLANDKTKEFAIPGSRGRMVLRVRKVTDDERKDADTTIATIVISTDAILMRKTPDGPLEEIPGKWAGVAREMRRTDLKSASAIAAIVLDNGVRVDRLAEKIIDWMAGVQNDAEQTLGE